MDTSTKIENISNTQSTSAHETSITLTYEGSNITFLRGDGVMVNATQMAKTFGSAKRPQFWLNTQQANDFINALSEARNLASADLVRVVKGGNFRQQGTWFHEDVAIEFARWLSPAFAIWTNDQIKILMTTGNVALDFESSDLIMARALQVAQRTLERHKQAIQILQGENEIQKEEIKVLVPKAEYTDEVLQSTSTFTTTQIAKDFGLSAKTLNKKLKEAGIQFFQSGQWFLYSKYQDKDYTDMRVSRYVNRHTGNVETQQSMVWTEKGRAFLHQLRKGGKL
jgi:phage antirepressor YoqD-like protein